MALVQADGAGANPLKILAIVASMSPSVSIGILRPMLTLERARVVDWRVVLEQSWTVDDVRAADIIVFCRNQSVEAYTAALFAKSEGKKIIYEIDDNFFEIPVNSSLGQVHRRPEFLHTTRRMFELADVTRVYSEKMSELAQSFGATVHHNKAYFDVSLVRDVTPKVVAGKVRIAFASGRSPDPIAEQALEAAIDDVIRVHPNSVEFHYWRAPGKLLRDRPQVVINRGVADYNEFIRRFYAAGYDIGLAPLLDTLFYESKTNSKYREYGGCGVAGIYSRSGPYEDCVVSGQNGLIVDNSREGWRSAILQLVDSPVLRRSIAENARADVERNYSYSEYVFAWQDTLRLAVDSKRNLIDIKPLFFHRNLAVSKTTSPPLLGRPKTFQAKTVRGGEWSSSTTFLTNLFGRFGKSEILDGPGVVNWLVVGEPDHLDAIALRTMAEAEIRIICDLRLQDSSTSIDLINRLKERGSGSGIVVCNIDQVERLGEDATRSELANVNHSQYPRPQRLPTSFGYLVVAPASRPLLNDMSLSGPDAVWLEIMDTISAFHPLGKPAGPRLPSWYLKLPMKRKLRYARFIRPREFLRGLLLRGAQDLYRYRWQRLRWTIQSDPAFEQKLRGNVSKSSADDSTRREEQE